MSELTIEQAQQQIKGLTAQIDAAKQMINESYQVSLNLRTNLNLYQQAHNELAQQNKTITESGAAVLKQLEEANAKIAELTPAA